MSRILALDYGRKRTGVAVTDTLQIIAGGLATVETGKLIEFLKEYFSREDVTRVIIGLPKTVRGEESESMNYIRPFMGIFRKTFPDIPIEFYDERFTSVMAHQTMLDSGISKKKRQDKALVDQISATIILQSYLESKRLF